MNRKPFKRFADPHRAVATLTGFTGEIRWQADKPDGQPRRRLDVSRAYEKFGFRAHMPLELGLQRTVEWYKQNANRSAANVV